MGSASASGDQGKAPLTALCCFDQASFDDGPEVGHRIATTHDNPRVTNQTFLLLAKAPCTFLEGKPVMTDGITRSPVLLVGRCCAAKSAGEPPLDAAIVRRCNPLWRQWWDRPSLEGRAARLDRFDGSRSQKDGLPLIRG